MMLLRTMLVFLGAVLVACGEGFTAPPGAESGINIVAGANVTDSVDARLPVPLRVVVLDTALHPLSDVPVRFSAVSISQPEGSMSASMLMSDSTATAATSSYTDTTSGNGEAIAWLTMGTVAGEGAIVITVPQESLRDTARFTITPGAVARTVLPIQDTTIQTENSLPLDGHTEDRHGNIHSSAPTYRSLGTGLTITGGQVSANSPTRGAVVGNSAVSDTTWVSVVPPATIAVRHGDKLSTILLDGTDLVEIPHIMGAGEEVAWHPNGQSLLALLGVFGGPPSLYRTELAGTVTQIMESGQSIGNVRDFAYSPDGEWVYAGAILCNYSTILYRFPVGDPQAAERISPVGLETCLGYGNQRPSPSPDGTRLTYEHMSGNRQHYWVRVLTLATGEEPEIVMGGQAPRWSPIDEHIAYWYDNRIWTVNSDGTDQRAITPPERMYVPGANWSPDGQWILARFEPRDGWAGTTIALLNVDTGEEIPLTWSTGYNTYGLPAWRPE